MSFTRSKGFTLTEMMIAMTIGVTMIGLTTLTTVDLYKNLTAAEAYRGIHTNAREAMAYMSRDIRSAIEVTSINPTNLNLNVISLTGSTNVVRYYLVNNAANATIKNLVRLETSGATARTNTLTDYATSLAFEYWANPGNPALTAGSTFEIRVSLVITNVNNFRISSDLLQTRVLMRNKHY